MINIVRALFTKVKWQNVFLTIVLIAILSVTSFQIYLQYEQTKTLNTKVDLFNNKLDEINSKLKRVQNDTSGLDSSISDVQSEVEDINSTISDITGEVDRISRLLRYGF